MNWKMAVTGNLALAMVLCAVPAQMLGADTNDLQVKTKQGKVEGKMDGEIRTFLGIPYAAPPVGALRWKAPMPPAKWSGVRQATTFGNRCMQLPIYHDMQFRDAGGSEDCLNLNVWSPAKDKKAKLPVMVWIYGGGFQGGAASEYRQDGAALAKNGVVVVSMNYRLGIFGFFATEELAKESGKNAAGNYGLMDQTAALQWVQKNIEAFGGDPNNVTLFGESAGSFSVNAQMASPLAKGLFKRVIGESGGSLYGSKGLSFKPLAETATADDAFAQMAFSTTDLKKLRALPAQEVLESSAKKSPTGESTRFAGDIDGYFLPESVAAIFAEGKQNDVPMLVGWNRDEGGLDPKTTVDSFKALVTEQFPDHAAEMLALNPVTDDAGAVRAKADLMADRFIAYSTWKWLEAQATTGKQPIYRFHFEQLPPADPFHPGGLAVYHSSEIPYVFGDLELLRQFKYPWTQGDLDTSSFMQRYWTNFAKTGDPNGPGLATWPTYSASTQWQVMHLDPHPMASPDQHRKQDLLLDSLWAK